MRIRSYRPNDEKKVIQLWVDCGLVAPQNNPIRDIERKRCVNPEWFLVGELEGSIIASCMAGYEGHRGWINYLAILPLFQRKGYGSKIMRRAEELLSDGGCPKVNLQVRATNHAVVEFYKSIGYQVEEMVSMGKRLEFDGSN